MAYRPLLRSPRSADLSNPAGLRRCRKPPCCSIPTTSLYKVNGHLLHRIKYLHSSRMHLGTCFWHQVASEAGKSLFSVCLTSAGYASVCGNFQKIFHRGQHLGVLKLWARAFRNSAPSWVQLFHQLGPTQCRSLPKQRPQMQPELLSRQFHVTMRMRGEILGKALKRPERKSATLKGCVTLPGNALEHRHPDFLGHGFTCCGISALQFPIFVECRRDACTPKPTENSMHILLLFRLIKILRLIRSNGDSAHLREVNGN